MSLMRVSSLRTSKLLINPFITTHPIYIFDHITIWVVQSGSCTVFDGIEEHHIHKNDFIILNLNTSYTLKTDNETEIYVVHLDEPHINKLASNPNFSINCCSSDSYNDHRYDYIKKYIIDLLSLQKKEDEYNVLVESSIMYSLAHFIFDNFRYKNIKPKTFRVNKSLKVSNRISDIVEYIDKHYQEKITLQEIAEKKFLSLSYLSKIFKEQLGVTFSEYIQNKRLRHAENELINTNLPVIRISHNSGFPNATIFNHLFKKQHGTTPLLYRKQKSKNNNHSLNAQMPALSIPIEKTSLWLPDWNLRSNFHDKLTYLSSSKHESINVNLSNGSTVIKPWSQLINIGHARDILDPTMREHLKLLQKDLSFIHGRFWGIFDEDVLLESPTKSNLSYNFDNIDKIIDFFYEINLYPFIELGPKPKVIHKNINEDISFLNTSSKQRNNDEIQSLLSIFLNHSVQRYGIDYVSKWHFELWHRDSDASGKKYWTTGYKNSSVSIKHDIDDDFFDLYAKLYAIIKKTSPLIQFGAWGGSPDINTHNLNLAFTALSKRNVFLDFLSIYVFSSELMSSELSARSPSTTEHDKISSFLDEFNRSFFKGTRIFVTEWNTTISNRSFINDTCHKASYLAKTAIDSIGIMSMLGHWIASDLFSNSYDTNNILNGQAGLLSKNGIRKPAYHALQFLSKIGDKLLDKGNFYALFSNDNINFQLVLHNHKNILLKNLLSISSDKNQILSNNLFTELSALFVSIKISGIENGNYRIKHFTIDEESGSILDEWIHFNNASYVTRDEVDYLKNRSIPKITISNVQVKFNELELDCLILPHGVELVTINKINVDS